VLRFPDRQAKRATQSNPATTAALQSTAAVDKGMTQATGANRLWGPILQYKLLLAPCVASLKISPAARKHEPNRIAEQAVCPAMRAPLPMVPARSSSSAASCADPAAVAAAEAVASSLRDGSWTKAVDGTGLLSRRGVDRCARASSCGPCRSVSISERNQAAPKVHWVSAYVDSFA